MIDLDLVKKKSLEYVNAHFSHLLEEGTLIHIEPHLLANEIKQVLLLNSIKCPGEISKVEFLYHAKPHCYLAEDNYGKGYGTRVIGVQMRSTPNGFAVNPYFDEDVKPLLTLISDQILDYVLVYNRSFFEAFVRAFLSDENVVVLAGPDDPVAFGVSMYNLSGGKENVRSMYIVSGDVYVAKIPKEDLLPIPYDTLFVFRDDRTVYNKPMSREEVFNMVMANYPETRSRLLEILARNDELRKAVEEVVEEVLSETEKNA